MPDPRTIHFSKETVFGTRQRVHGKPRDFQGNAIIAFIDLLGFSADVKRHWRSKTKSPLERLMRLKGRVQRGGERLSGQQGWGKIRRTARGLTATFPEWSLHGVRVHTVSDSLVLCYALPKRLTPEVFWDAFRTLYFSIQGAWISALDEGYTIRGGIEVGDIYWSETETIGPALVDAYTLESKVAQWSRIVCGPMLLRRLLECIKDGEDKRGSFQLPRRLPQLVKLFGLSHDRLIEVPFFDVMDPAPESKGYLRIFGKLASRAGANAAKYGPILADLSYAGQLYDARRGKHFDEVKRLEQEMQDKRGASIAKRLTSTDFAMALDRLLALESTPSRRVT
ncbi:hypothetical protein [Bradyrhizobium sp. SZCCHNRI20481]|uniref:hypothetical protein n=1 Tax=Bradyrhizobium sp. SZCCHNRI20481 TaxID=3057286 RepID=UPI00291652F3|nr:hypothetical protein [Bradyrhizobium sp. SZCCHNRI20481]